VVIAKAEITSEQILLLYFWSVSVAFFLNVQITCCINHVCLKQGYTKGRDIHLDALSSKFIFFVI
jgi:hypothetical protein